MSDPIHVIVPALDEEQTLPFIFERLATIPNINTIVVDNGSRDGTADVARAHGATVVAEARRGYGAACLAGIAALSDRPDAEIVVFLDADGSDDPAILPELIAPLTDGSADLSLASRTIATAEPGSLTLPQRFGNWLACALMRHLWRQRYTDLAPYRALKLGTLRSLDMDDLNYGWTVQMQVRAARKGLRVAEIPSHYRRRRAGRSKISGTMAGTLKAGAIILSVLLKELSKVSGEQ